MSKTIKRILAMALVLCSVISYTVPAANAASNDTTTLSFDLTDYYVYNTIPVVNDNYGILHYLVDGYTSVTDGETKMKSMKDRYLAGEQNWTYEAASASICGSETTNEHLTNSGTRMISMYKDSSGTKHYGIRTTMAGTESAWLAFRFHSPGAGEYTLDFEFYNGNAGAPTLAFYILDPSEIYTTEAAQGGASNDHDTVLARQACIQTAMDPNNRIGKVDENAVAKSTLTTAYVGEYTFEADKEYILVAETYEKAAIPGNWAYLQKFIFSTGGTVEKTKLTGDPEVGSILVEENLVPAADGGYMAAVAEVNGHDYYFRPLEGGKMAIYDLDKHVAGEESLVATVSTGLYYPTHATVTDDGRVIVGGDGRKLFVFNTKTMTGRTTPDFRSTEGLSGEGHNQGSHYGSDGYLYFGTLYGGHLVQYDIDARTYTDLGDVVTASVRALAGITANTEEETGGVRATYYHNGYLYAKVDSDNYTLIVKQDVANKETVAAIDVTEQLHGSGVPHGITVLGDKYLIAGGSSASGMVLIDLETFTLVEYNDVVSKGLFASKTSAAQDAWENGMGGHASEVINGKQYFYVNNAGMYSYDVDTGMMAQESTNDRPLRTGQKSKVTLDLDEDGTEETYVLTFAGSGPRLFNISTKKSSVISDLVIDTSAVGGSSINIGDSYDDVLYIGAWNNWNCVAYDTVAEAIKSRYVTGGQTDSQVSYVDDDGTFHLVSGNYSACVVYEIDPLNKTGYGDKAESNILMPLISNMKKYEQKRIHTVAGGDGYVFAGTIPTSYVTGGGVGVYNRATGEEDFIRFKENPVNGENVVPNSELWDLAVQCIEYYDGRLFGTTTRSGGSGSKAVDGTSARIFVMDYENMTIEATLDLREYLTLVDADGDGAEDPINYIGGIQVDDQGRFWGLCSDVLFCFTYDKTTKTFAVKEVLNLDNSEYVTSAAAAWKSHKVAFDPANYQMFVSFYKKGLQQVVLGADNWNAAVSDIDVTSITTTQILSGGPATFALGANNNLYYASGTDLYMKPVNVADDDAAWTNAQNVDNMLEALGDITADKADAVEAVKAAYKALSLREKALVQETRYLKEVEAQVLELQIEEAIANVTADSTKELGELILQYNELDESQQRYVQNYTALETAYSEAMDLNYYAAANAVVEQIAALGDPATLADEEAAVAAREAYELLDAELKAKVTNLSKLEAAEANIAALKQEAADVQAQIDALNVTSVDEAEAVGAARSAYEALSDEQKALVDETALVEAEAVLAEYVSAAQVQEKIDALPDSVTLDNEATVNAVRAEYDALSDTAKAAVDTTKLVSAETQIADIKAAQAVQAQIDALPETVTLDDESAVKAARKAYNALSTEGQAKVDTTKLVAAEARIAELKAAQAAQAKIDALPDELVIEDMHAIVAARTAYEALSDEMKTLVDTAKLETAEAALAELEKNAVPTQVVYDFELYRNPVFYTDCTQYTYDATEGRILTNMNASKRYNSTYASIAQWFYASYAKTINWGVETSVTANVAYYVFRGETDQGMRISDVTAVGDYGSLRLFVPAAGTYTFDFEAGNIGIVADVYVIPASTVYATERTPASTLTAAMTEENLLVSGLNIAGNKAVEAAGQWTFDAAGDYIIIFNAQEANSKGISLRTITLNPVIDETTAVAQVGEELFLSLDQAIAYQIENGAEKVNLFQDATVGDLVLESNAVLDLNGKTLTADSVLSYSSSAIIDSSEKDTGVLKINDAEGNMLSSNNAQLPVYDETEGGYRFFEVAVKVVTVTGKNSDAVKYWFKIDINNFGALYNMINAGSELNIAAKLTWEGGEAEAVAGADFLQKWAEKYNATNGDFYITVSAVNAEGLESFSLIPCITANGVEICGDEM